MRNWNQKAVRERLQAFKEVAAAVPGNQRTAYTERGGRKMLPAHHPERLWIDSYSAIKTKISGVNATFVCHIREAGDEPKFELRINGKVEPYNADGLCEALSKWRAIAERAS